MSLSDSVILAYVCTYLWIKDLIWLQKLRLIQYVAVAVPSFTLLILQPHIDLQLQDQVQGPLKPL